MRIFGSIVVIAFGVFGIAFRKRVAAIEAVAYRWYSGEPRTRIYSRVFEAAVVAFCTLIIAITALHLFGVI